MSTPTERSALVARLARFALRLVLAGAGLYLLWSGGLVLANFAVLGVPEPPSPSPPDCSFRSFPSAAWLRDPGGGPWRPSPCSLPSG